MNDSMEVDQDTCFKRGVDLYSQIFESKPYEYGFATKLSYCLWGMNRYDEALEVAEKAVSHSSNNCLALFVLANAHCGLNHMEDYKTFSDMTNKYNEKGKNLEASIKRKIRGDFLILDLPKVVPEGRRRRRHVINYNNVRGIWVGNVASDVSLPKARQVFGPYGDICNIQFAERGNYVIITYTNTRAPKLAVEELDNSIIPGFSRNEKALKVRFVKRSRNHF